jgi:hypothetical protein
MTRHQTACDDRFSLYGKHELGVLLKLPPERRDPLDTVVELQMEGSGVR